MNVSDKSPNVAQSGPRIEKSIGLLPRLWPKPATDGSSTVTRVPGNMVAQSLKAAPLAIVALVGSVLGVSTEVPGLPAAVAVFIPALVLVPVSIAMVSTIKT